MDVNIYPERKGLQSAVVINLFVIARNALLEFFVRVKKVLDVKHKPVSDCFGETNVSPCFGSVQFGKRMRSNDCTIVERFPYSRLPTKDSRIANAGPSRLPPKAIMQSSQSFWFCVEPLFSSQTVFFALSPQDGTLQVLALGEFSEKHPFEIVELDQLESGRGSDSMVGVLPWLESLAEFCQWKTPGNLWSVFFECCKSFWRLKMFLGVLRVWFHDLGIFMDWYSCRSVRKDSNTYNRKEMNHSQESKLWVIDL